MKKADRMLIKLVKARSLSKILRDKEENQTKIQQEWQVSKSVQSELFWGDKKTGVRN